MSIDIVEEERLCVPSDSLCQDNTVFFLSLAKDNPINDPTGEKCATGQSKDSIEDIGDKMKAASKAAATKVKDPETDINAEYRKEKMKEEALESSPSADSKVSKLIPFLFHNTKEYWYQTIVLNILIKL